MSLKINLLNQRFGRLLVIADAGHNRYGKALWLCACDCGNETVVLSGSLLSGRQTGCRCIQKERLAARSTTHGNTTGGKWSNEYVSWVGMIQRCTNPHSKDWPYYGGRGITICQHWRDSFAQFLNDVGERPEPNFTLDKDTPGGNGHYHCPACGGRVEWATRKTQYANRHLSPQEVAAKSWATKRAHQSPIQSEQSHPRDV